MIRPFISQLIAISFYVLFVFYSFCDGFNVRLIRKVAWAIIFVWICILSLQVKGDFDLLLILPLPSVLALFLCWHEKKSKEKQA